MESKYSNNGTRGISTQKFCNCQTSILKCMNSRQWTSGAHNLEDCQIVASSATQTDEGVWDEGSVEMIRQYDCSRGRKLCCD